MAEISKETVCTFVICSLIALIKRILNWIMHSRSGWNYFSTMSIQIIHFNEEVLLCIRNGRNNNAKSYIQTLISPHKLIDSAGATLLHYAAEYGNGGITKYLLELGSNIDAQNSEGQTPLMLAIQEERVTSIRVLLDCNANIHVSDKNGRSALQMVVQGSLISQTTIQAFLNRLREEMSFDSRSIAQKLRAIGCSLRIALFLQDSQVTRSMLDSGDCEIDEPDPETGETALHIAVRQLSLEDVQLLVEHGANVNSESVDGCTPLYHLEWRSLSDCNGLEILKILLDRGAMMFTETDDNSTKKCQIIFILRCGCKQAIKLIMQYDVDFYAVDKQGSTVLHYLARNQNPGVFDELQGKQFDANIRNNSFYTPLELATDNLSSFQFLASNGANVNSPRNGFTPLTTIFRASHFALPMISVPTPLETLSKEYELVKVLLRHGADPQYVSPDGITIFDRDIATKMFSLLKPVLAHLAILEDTGSTSITQIIRGKFNAASDVMAYYHTCKSQLNDLKTIQVWESITAYKLLTVDERQLTMYMRQRDKIVKVLHGLTFGSIYLKELMHERVDKAILTAQLLEKSTANLCDLLGLLYEKYYNVIESMIVSYLSERDMRNLCALFSEQEDV